MSALNFPSPATPGQVFDNWQWDGSKWVTAPGLVIANTIDEVPIAFVFPGSPNTGWSVFLPITIPLTLPDQFAGSYGFVGVPPVGSVNVNFNTRTGPNASGSPTTIGQATVSPTGITFSSIAGAPFALSPGMTLQAVLTNQDTAVNTISLVLLATRV